jgi:hypothetical protein
MMPGVVLVVVGLGGIVLELTLSEPCVSMLPDPIRGVWGILWAVFGASVLWYRWGSVVDRTAGTVTRWWGVPGVYTYRRVRSLRPEEVRVEGKINDMDDLYRTIYRVSLVEAGACIALASGESAVESRGIAEELAGFHDVPLVDNTPM